MPHTAIVLKKMCEIIGEDFTTFNFDEKEWYLKNTWTTKQQNEFKKWMANYIYTNKGARHEMLSIDLKNKKLINKAVEWFIFNYGWKNE